MQNNPLISVIVAFYNVKQYVSYCLDSLLGQSYDDFEIVCIDDGSTDGTSELLDAYSDDPKVSVYHVRNSGLSSARNIGVSVAKGQYVSFVDGDDIVSPYYLETLTFALWQFDCDIAIGRHARIKGSVDGISHHAWSRSFAIEIKDEHDAIEGFLYDDPMISSWAHLLKKEVYLSHPFPNGKVFEDTLMFKWHIMGFKKYAICTQPIYGYVVRSGSITSIQGASVEKISALLHALSTLEKAVECRYSDLKDACEYHKSLEYVRIIARLRASKNNNESDELYCSILQKLRGGLSSVIANPRVRPKMKARIAIAAIMPTQYAFLISLYNKKRSRLGE